MRPPGDERRLALRPKVDGAGEAGRSQAHRIRSDNVQKRQSAEAASALRGRRMRHDREGDRCDRPALRVGIWKVAGDRTKALMGLTAEGYDLLEQLDGISLRLPHSQEHAQRFFGHPTGTIPKTCGDSGLPWRPRTKSDARRVSRDIQCAVDRPSRPSSNLRRRVHRTDA